MSTESSSVIGCLEGTHGAEEMWAETSDLLPGDKMTEGALLYRGVMHRADP